MYRDLHFYLLKNIYMTQKNKIHYKDVFLSDLHIGTPSCKIKKLNQFLSSFTCENLWLCGDIIDGWAISKGHSRFTQAHVNVLRKFLTKAKNGTKIYYVIGNHDEFLRTFNDEFNTVGNITFANEFEYTSASGIKYLVTHGDLYDSVIKYHKWVAHLGDNLYTLLVWLNTHLNWVRSKFNFGYWSLAGFLKTKVKSALEFINSYEENLCYAAQQRGYSGIICGHIHSSANKFINNIHYLNCGDGVESCTAIVINEEDILSIIEWDSIIKTES